MYSSYELLLPVLPHRELLDDGAALLPTCGAAGEAWWSCMCVSGACAAVEKQLLN